MNSDNSNQCCNDKGDQKKDGQEDEKSDPSVEEPENEEPVKKDRDEGEVDKHKMM